MWNGAIMRPKLEMVDYSASSLAVELEEARQRKRQEEERLVRKIFD